MCSRSCGRRLGLALLPEAPAAPSPLVIDALERLVCAVLPTARRQHAAPHRATSRPWPPPEAPWLMAQTWEELLFAHWAVPPEQLRPALPPGLSLDVRDGAAWIGVTPFRVRGLRLRGTPPVPGLSRFAELNVRTYVTAGARPGIWFFSLDAARRAAVLAARRGYRLPYFHARMRVARRGGWIEYASDRRDSAGAPASLRARYGPAGPVRRPAAGTLEHFLTERYCLYAVHPRRGLLRAEIAHEPWPLQPAEATLRHNTMAAPLGLALEERPLLHYARRLDVVIWPPQTLDSPR